MQIFVHRIVYQMKTAFKYEGEVDLFRHAKSEGIHFQLANPTRNVKGSFLQAEGKPQMEIWVYTME